MLWLLMASTLAGCGWIDLPGSPQPLGKGTSLELFSVSSTNVAGTRAAAGPDAGSTIYLIQPPIIVSSEVETVQLRKSTPSMPELVVNLTPAGAKKMSAATTPPKRQQLALVVNGKVLAAPTVMATISDSLILGGMLTDKDCDEFFDSLTAE